MKTKEYLDKVAYIGKSKIEGGHSDAYYSKFDDSYITLVGMEESISFLAEREITEELTHGTGFSPKDNKWYGWSFIDIYGFTIGSTCKKGDCHYIGATLKDQIEAAVDFWKSDSHTKVWFDRIEVVDGVSSIIIKYTYNNSVPNKKLRGTTKSVPFAITSNGKGEWVAKTMADAKQMAIDFSNSVSEENSYDL